MLSVLGVAGRHGLRGRPVAARRGAGVRVAPHPVQWKILGALPAPGLVSGAPLVGPGLDAHGTVGRGKVGC